MHQCSQTRVIRRIKVKHVALQRSEHRRHPGHLPKLFRSHRSASVLDEAFISKQRRDILVARYQPDRSLVRKRRAVNGLGSAQTSQEWKRIRFELRAYDVHLWCDVHCLRRTSTDSCASMVKLNSFSGSNSEWPSIKCLRSTRASGFDAR